MAYAQIPRAERSVRHRRAAEWIASLGRSQDHAELLAHHYLEAIGYARASGGDLSAFTGPALAALREAGERAVALGAYQAAARYFKAALELDPRADRRRGELLYGYGGALLVGTNRGEEVLEAGVQTTAAAGPRDGGAGGHPAFAPDILDAG